MKKESFVNKISIYIGVTLVLLIWLLTAYTVSSFLLLKESEESSVWSTIQIYMKQIDSKFIAMDQCVEGIAGNQDLIGQICYGSPADRYYAAVELQKSMKRDVISNTELDYVLIAESLNKNLIAASTPGVSYGEKEAIASYIWNLMEKEDRGRPQWYYTKIGTHAYIAKIYRGSNWSVAAFSKENTFLSDIRAKEYPDGQSFLLTDANGVCVENLEEGNSMYLGETLEIEDSWKNDHKKRMISLKSDRAGLYITGMIGSNHFLGKFSTNSILILLIMVLAIGCDITPALGGEPRDKAMALLETYEAHERGMYAAPFGFMKDMGDGIVVVAIRSALIMDDILYAYAGCGVVADSDADEEYIETNNKMRTILDAL